MFEMRKSTPAEVPAITAIYESARKFLKESGVDQWQDGYPGAGDVMADILRGESYVFIEDGELLGTLALTFSGDEYYGTLKGGSWPNDEKYASIHRIAVAKRRMGVGSRMIEAADMLCRMRGIMNMRSDTHRNNLAMQGLLKSQGFELAGEVNLPRKTGDTARNAYYKVLTDGCKCCHAGAQQGE